MVGRLKALQLKESELRENIFGNGDDVCIADGTFLLPSMSTTYAFTYVRNPVARFISGIHPHGKWKVSDICNDIPCDHVQKEILDHAERYLDNDRLPTSVGIVKDKVGRRLPHWLTIIFLSATHASGTPVAYGDVYKLEDMSGKDDTPLPPLVLGDGTRQHRARPKSNADNVGGSRNVKRLIKAWIESESRIMCPLCRVYAQDFVCLGYDIPPICKERC